MYSHGLHANHCRVTGQRDIRRLLIIGASAVIAASERKGRCDDLWLADMISRKPRLVVASPVGLGPMAPSPVDPSPIVWHGGFGL